MLHTSVILENPEDNVQNIYMPRFPRCLDPKFFGTKGFDRNFLIEISLIENSCVTYNHYQKWMDISDF